MRIIAWLCSALATLLLLIAISGGSWAGMALTFGALLLVLPPVWRGYENYRFGGGTRAAVATVLLIGGLGATMFTVNHSPEGRAIASETRRLGDHCLASDGSPEKLVSLLKSTMRNPSSFEHVRTKIEPVDANGQHRVFMQYRGQNGFGGMNLEGVEATLNSADCTVTMIG